MSQTQLPNGHGVSIFSLESGRPLLNRICERLGSVPGRHEEQEFGDGEHKIRPLESVRGRDVYIVESLYRDERFSVDEKLMRVLFFIAAARDAGASRVTAIAPYLCYSRQDLRNRPRDPVTTLYVAMLFEAVGVDRMVTIDVHNLAAYQNAFRIPTEHLSGARAFTDALAPLVGDHKAVVVSPDTGGAKRAEHFRQALEQRLERPVGFALIEKFRRDGGVRGGAVVGDVKDRVAIILDDLISSGTTLVHAAVACHKAGVRVTYAAATHGVFAAGASRLLSGCGLERIVILDTIRPHGLDRDFLEKCVQVIDCAPLLAAAIHRLHTDGSIVDLAEP